MIGLPKIIRSQRELGEFLAQIQFGQYGLITLTMPAAEVDFEAAANLHKRDCVYKIVGVSFDPEVLLIECIAERKDFRNN